jgi:hypothetical protein
VGWLTNFIHQPNAVHINMLRGWSTSSFSNAVGRDVIATINTRLQKRGSKPAKRGFLLDAVERVDKRRRLTVKGGGDVTCNSNVRNSSRVTTALFRGLKQAIQQHAAELDLSVPHVVSDTVTQMVGGVRINGRPWKKGDMCFYYLPTDRAIDCLPRVGQVHFFVVEQIGRSQVLFVCVDQRVIIERKGSLIVFNVVHPPVLKYFNIDHLTHLVASLPFFHAGRPDIRVGVPIAPTN